MKNSVNHNNLFQNIVTSSAQGIVVFDENGCILTANPASEQMFGYGPGELANKNIDILISKKLNFQRENHNKDGQFPLKTETNIRGIKKSGDIISLSISLNPMTMDGKNVTLAFFWDTTQHKADLRKIKKTNSKLKESNRKFDTLINNQKGIVYRCQNNRNYDMEFISEGCEEITGYPSKDFISHSQSIGNLILPEDRDTVWKSVQDAIIQRKPYNVEYRIHHKNKAIKYVWEKGVAVYNEHDEVVALEGFINDITPQKELEFTLKTNQAKTKALLEAIPDTMFIQDHKGVYLDCYTKTPEKLIVPPEKFIGLDMKEVLPSDLYQKIKISHNKVIETGAMQIAEYSIPKNNGFEQFEARVVLMNNHSLLTILRDVTRERTQAALLSIQNNALASASNSIVIADAQQPNTPIIYSNAAFEKMTGYSQEEVLGKSSHFLQNDDRDQKEIGIMKNAIAQGEACRVSLRNYRKDGSMFWNEVSITPVYDEENKLTHFIGVQNDISEKVRGEKLKDQTREVLELIVRDKPLKTIGTAIVEAVDTYFKDCVSSFLLLDTQYKTLHQLAAPNVPRSFGSQAEENLKIGPASGSAGTAAFLGKDIILTDIHTSIFWENLKEVAMQHDIKASWSFPIMSSAKQVLGTLTLYSSQVRKPTEEEKKVLLDMTHLASIAIEKHNSTVALKENRKNLKKHTENLEKTVQERTEEVMATVQKLVETNLNLEDQIRITKLAESAALSSKSIASEIARNFPNGFVVVMDRDSKVIFAKGDALSQLGLETIFHEGMTVDDIPFFSQRRKDLIKENIVKTLSGEHLSFEVNYKGRYFTVNTAPLVDENNTIINALHVYNDISHQKEIEFAFQGALKKEQELNELKSRFISMASHEFRTPLSAILTSAILIGKQNGQGKEHKRERYLAQIEKNVNNLTVILNDFLSLSKLEEGKVVSSPTRFDLVAFSKNLVHETAFAGLKAMQSINLSSPEELFVHMDEKLLGLILNNLISNASKYSPEEGCIDFKILQKGESVALQISDKGIGIPLEEQKHLFSRFFRAKNAANIEGTGLGLNIAKRYIELMGGSIEFKSEINRGTTFSVELPINP